METSIKTLNDIDYKDKGAGALLFTALTILTTQVYPKNTPDEVIEILNNKSGWWEEENKSDIK